MKKIIVGAIACMFIVGCSGGQEVESSKPEQSRYVLMKSEGDYTRKYDFAIDTRTGCMKSVTTVQGGFTYSQVTDKKGLPVGCEEAGGLTVEEYLALEPNKGAK